MKRKMIIGCMAAMVLGFVGQVGFASDMTNPMLAREAKFDDGVIALDNSDQPLAVAEIKNETSKFKIITGVDQKGKAYKFRFNIDGSLIDGELAPEKYFGPTYYQNMLRHRGDVASALEDGQEIYFDSIDAVYRKPPATATIK